jgi:hypothetical protein
VRHNGADAVRHAVERGVVHHHHLPIGGDVNVAFGLLDRQKRAFAEGARAILGPKEKPAAMGGDEGAGHGPASWPAPRP